MSKYRINKMYIKNFKLVDEATINFEDNDIVVLDGPNGFGKTTIFDALELVLTGSVSRIREDDGRRIYKDILFSKDGNITSDIILKVEFIKDGENNVVIARKLESQIDIPINQRKPTNFSMFTTHILANFDDNLSEENEKKQSDIENIFDLAELERLYKLYFYIQQEESTRYLKGSEKNRKDEISHLFNTKKENDEKIRVLRLRKLLKKEENKLTNVLGQLEIEYKDVEKSESIISTVKYKRLIPTAVLNPWDHEKLIIESEEDRKAYIDKLMNIREFINQTENFKKMKHNKKIDSLIKNKRIIQDAVIIAEYMNEYKEIEQKYLSQIKLEQFIKISENKTKLLSITKEKIKKLEKILNVDINVDGFLSKATSIRFLQQNSSGITNILLELNDIRKTLLDKYKEYERHKDNDDNECPFCGNEWKSQDALYNNIEAKRLKYLKMYDQNAEQLEKEFQELLAIYNEEIIAKINNNKHSEEVSEAFYEQLKKSYANSSLVTKFIKWCDINQIPIKDFSNKVFNYILSDAELNEKVQILSNLINELKQEIDWDIEEYDKLYDQFNWIYKDLFNEDIILVELIEKNDIDDKIQYINEYYANTQYMTKNDIVKKIQNVNEKLACIKTSLVRTKVIIEIYTESIIKYELKIINDIEILFYIYSGRILQYYQRGMGIFIQNTTGGLKFISNIETDHDAVNYLSSGQLSALVLSFTFTLNKIYSKSKLGVLLIDDPVQTMDDINMASLAELLRNELSGRQIIISTHEDNVSRFLRYRFSKYGLKHRSINVKEEL